MVCKRCEQKLGKLIVPDKWKEGSRSENRSQGLLIFYVLNRVENEEEGRAGVIRSIEHSRRTMK